MKAFLKRKKSLKNSSSAEGSVQGDSGDDEEEFHDTFEVSEPRCSGPAGSRAQCFENSAFTARAPLSLFVMSATCTRSAV